MQLSQSIRHGTIWLFTGNISQRGLEFIIGIILARILLPSDFGILITIQIFTGTASLFAGGGMTQAIIYTKKITPDHFNVAFTLQLIICSFIYISFYQLSPWIAIFFNNELYIDLVRVSTLTFLLRPFSNIARARLHRKMKFKSIALINVFSLLITGLISVALAKHNYGVWSLIIGGVSGAFFTVTILLIATQYFPRLYYNHKIAKELGSYGFKSSFNDILLYFRLQIPNFLLGKFTGPAAVGLFNKGDSLSETPNMIIGDSARQTVFRALSSIQADLEQSKYIYLRTITLVSVYTFPFFTCLWWLAEPFVDIVYGEKWIKAAGPLQILSIAGFFNCLSYPSIACLAAQNKLSIQIKIQLLAFLITVVSCTPGIILGDIKILAIGLIPTAIFLSISQSYLSIKALKSKFSLFLSALKPALRLNILLLLVLIISDYLIQRSLNDLTSFHYFSLLSVISIIIYTSLFLFYPNPSLKNETNKWKKYLRIPIR